MGGIKTKVKAIILIVLTALFRLVGFGSDKTCVWVYSPLDEKGLRIPFWFGESFAYGVFLESYCDKVNENEEIRIKPPVLKKPVALRARSSDIMVFFQIFVAKEFDVPVDFSPEFIIDGGANIGCFSVLYASLFPEATICAVEPECSNFALLKRNAEEYDNIQCIQSGIWNKNTCLKVNDNPHKWGVSVCETGADDPEGFQAITINDITKRFEGKRLDILKLDIEGSEQQVFMEGYEDWLGSVQLLIIELHEKYHPGSSKSFFEAIRNYDFERSEIGEHLVLRRKERAGPSGDSGNLGEER